MTTTTNTIPTMTTPVHKFEAAGLGKAPFKFLGCEERRGPMKWIDPKTGQWDGCTEVGSPGQPMGTCAYCGQGIAFCCMVRSADGKRFIVGSDCIAKVGDAGLRRSLAPEKTKARKDREQVRIDAARAAMADEAVRAALTAQPHPNGYRAERGETRLAWAEWLMQNAGNTGRLQVARAIEAIVAAAK